MSFRHQKNPTIETKKNILNKVFMLVLTGFCYCPSPGISDNLQDTFVEAGVNAFNERLYSKALKEWGKALNQGSSLALEGDFRALNNIGVMYERGLGVRQDFKEAEKRYKIAASNGSTEAKHNLGLLYHLGNGVNQDDTKAFNWFRKAAIEKLPESEYMLGLLYYLDLGLPLSLKDSERFSEAKSWFLMAARKGYPEAQFMVGYLFNSGQLKSVNNESAFIWTYIAKENGFEMASALNYENEIALCDGLITVADIQNSRLFFGLGDQKEKDIGTSDCDKKIIRAKEKALMCTQSQYKSCPE